MKKITFDDHFKRAILKINSEQKRNGQKRTKSPVPSNFGRVGTQLNIYV